MDAGDPPRPRDHLLVIYITPVFLRYNAIVPPREAKDMGRFNPKTGKAEGFVDFPGRPLTIRAVCLNDLPWIRGRVRIPGTRVPSAEKFSNKEHAPVSPDRVDKLAKRLLPRWIRLPIRYARLHLSLKAQAIRELLFPDPVNRTAVIAYAGSSQKRMS